MWTCCLKKSVQASNKAAKQFLDIGLQVICLDDCLIREIVKFFRNLKLGVDFS